MKKVSLLSVQERQIFVTTEMVPKSAVGHFAILTNYGLIIYNGAISNDGIYYSRDEYLPEVSDKKDGALRAYKRLCANGVDNDHLTNFPVYFGKLEEIADRERAWQAVQDTLNDPKGRQFKEKYDFQIHALINMRDYGILYDSKNNGHLCDGYLCVDAVKQTLILKTIERRD